LLNPLVRRTLAPRGQTPILLQRGRHRQKVSLIAALTISPRRSRLGLYFRSLPDAYFRQDDVAAFVRHLLRHLRGRVILVWDRWSGHRGEAIRAVEAAHPRLELVDLPAYAPDLNPVEFLWNHLKWGELANFAPSDSADLNATVVPILERITADQHRLRSYWRGAHLKLPRRRLTT
jgi:hypothetical protein